MEYRIIFSTPLTLQKIEQLRQTMKSDFTDVLDLKDITILDPGNVALVSFCPLQDVNFKPLFFQGLTRSGFLIHDIQQNETEPEPSKLASIVGSPKFVIAAGLSILGLLYAFGGKRGVS